MDELLTNLDDFGTWLLAQAPDYYFWQQEGFTPIDAWLDDVHTPYSHYITGNCEVVWYDAGERAGYVALPEKATTFLQAFGQVIGEGPGGDRVDAAMCVELWREL